MNVKKYTRTTILKVNDHQKKFFYPVMAAFFLGCVTAWLTLMYFVIGEFLVAPEFNRLQNVIPYLLIVTTLAMFLVLFWTFRLTSRYFGAYERFLEDLDDIIRGDQREELEVRDGDVLFGEIIKRINTLMSKKTGSGH